MASLSLLQRGQIRAFAITYVSFMALHAARKAFSNAKIDIQEEWEVPASLLGSLDGVWMFFYAVGLYFSGWLGDVFEVKRVYAVGLAGTAAVVGLFGFLPDLGFSLHEYPSLYMAIWGLNGLVQSLGWPCAVAIMGNWFDEHNSGRVFGVWASTGNTGNIAGSLLVLLCVSHGLAIKWMFYLPAVFSLAMAALVYTSAQASPAEAGIRAGWEKLADEEQQEIEDELGDLDADLELLEREFSASSSASPTHGAAAVTASSSGSSVDSRRTKPPAVRVGSNSGPKISSSRPGSAPAGAINFWEAWRIPGVIQYSFCYACLKAVVYSMYFWLPMFLHTERGFSTGDADLLSNVYDLGIIAGGVAAGWATDRAGARAPVLVAMLATSTVPLFVTYMPGQSTWSLTVWMTLAGVLTGGPNNLIGSAVSAELGKDPRVHGAKAMATITGIVDGTGSLGAAVGQFLIARLIEQSWTAVFGLLVVLQVAAALCLWTPFWDDVRELRGGSLARGKWKAVPTSDAP